MPTYSLKVICGESTCFDKTTEKMCKFVLTSGFGQRWLCGLFWYKQKSGDSERYPLSEEDGYLKRCPPCMDELKAQE